MTERARLVVFDKAAGTDEGVDVRLNPERHEVVATAKHLVDAANLLLALKEGSLGDVHAVIITGSLEGEDEYARRPASYPEVVPKRSLLGKEKTKVVNKVVGISQGLDRGTKSAEVTARLIDGLFDDDTKPIVLGYSRGYSADRNMYLSNDAPMDAVLVDSPSESAKVPISDWVDRVLDSFKPSN